MDAIFFKAVLYEGLLGAFLASIGFGVLFNVRGKSLIFAGITGGIGGMVYKAALQSGLDDPLANFLAATVLSILSEIFARKMLTTVTTFTACALIPLVPGGTAYEMMIDFSQGNGIAGLNKLMSVISISGMLAIGILMVSTLTRFFFYSKKTFKKTKESVFYHYHYPKSKHAASKVLHHLPKRKVRRKHHETASDQ